MHHTRFATTYNLLKGLERMISNDCMYYICRKAAEILPDWYNDYLVGVTTIYFLLPDMHVLPDLMVLQGKGEFYRYIDNYDSVLVMRLLDGKKDDIYIGGVHQRMEEVSTWMHSMAPVVTGVADRLTSAPRPAAPINWRNYWISSQWNTAQDLSTTQGQNQCVSGVER